MLKMTLASIGILVLLLGAPIIMGEDVALGEDEDSVSTSLDHQWESIMIEGKSFIQIDGELLKPGGTPYQTYKGEVDQVWISDRGIRLDDLREISLGGLLTKGGWRLEGGLLSAASRKGGGLVELYGKSRWKVQPALFHFGKSPPKSANHSYDFFLLHRPVEGGTAEVLKKWTIPADKIPYDYYLRGQLTYDPGSDLATVTVNGINDDRMFLSEDVHLGKIRRAYHSQIPTILLEHR